MSNIYEWSVESIGEKITVGEQTDIVQLVHWRLEGTDGTHVVSTAGATHIPYTESESFVPFSELTQAEVISWVKTQIDLDATVPETSEGRPTQREPGISVAGYEHIIDQLIAQKVAEATPPALPWV